MATGQPATVLGEEAALPAALFVFICMITASVLAAFWERVDREREALA